MEITEGKNGSKVEELAIKVEDLTVAYRDRPVLWDIDLDVPTGVLMAIVGPNGAGKTTLIKVIMNLIRPVAGKILCNWALAK